MNIKLIKELNNLISGLEVLRVKSHHKNEIMIEFTNGTRLYVDIIDGELDLSIT